MELSEKVRDPGQVWLWFVEFAVDAGEEGQGTSAPGTLRDFSPCVNKGRAAIEAARDSEMGVEGPKGDGEDARLVILAPTEATTVAATILVLARVDGNGGKGSSGIYSWELKNGLK